MKICIYRNNANWFTLKCKTQCIDGRTLHNWVLDRFKYSIWIQGIEKTTDVVLDKFADSTFSSSKSKVISSSLINIRDSRISFWYQDE